MFRRYARNGGAVIFSVGEDICAVSIINPRISSLIALCVMPSYRSRGVGKWVLDFLRPNFVRAIESSVVYFEARGYASVGDWHQGRRHRTRVMVRSNLPALAGRLRRLRK